MDCLSSIGSIPEQTVLQHSDRCDNKAAIALSLPYSEIRPLNDL